MAEENKEVLGDVRYNAVFFMLGIFAIGLSFLLQLITSLLPYVQGGPVAGAASEYAVMVSLSAALGGVGFMSLGVGAVVFAYNYEPIREEAKLVAFSGVPYGIFLLAYYGARLSIAGVNDFFAYAVSRTASGTPNLLVPLPESFATLGPYAVAGAVAAAVCTWGLAAFLSNMKIVKDVGSWTVGFTKALGPLILVSQVLMFAGFSSFTTDNASTEWLGAPFVAYYIGYLIWAFAVPLIGMLVAVKVGSIFWDAAKTVRYLSDFRKRAASVAESRNKARVDDRPWWERIADDKKDEK